MTFDELLKEKYLYIRFINGQLEMYTDIHHSIPYDDWFDVFPFAMIPIDGTKIKSIVRRPNRSFIVVTNKDQVWAIKPTETLEQLLERITK